MTTMSNNVSETAFNISIRSNVSNQLVTFQITEIFIFCIQLLFHFIHIHTEQVCRTQRLLRLPPLHVIVIQPGSTLAFTSVHKLIRPPFALTTYCQVKQGYKEVDCELVLMTQGTEG